MNKIIYFLMMISVFITPLIAKKPTLAMLKSIDSNAQQKFAILKYEFICKPYGVITVDELYNEAKSGSTCKASINEFYRQNPREKYFSASILKVRQYYHIEFKNNRCIIYAKGLNTLSELLLSKGLAVKKSTFEDEEFEYNFTEAQVGAKENKRGIYKNKIKYKCIAELFSLEKKETR